MVQIFILIEMDYIKLKMRKQARDRAVCQQIAANKRGLEYTKMCRHAFLPQQVFVHALQEVQPKEGKKEIFRDTQTDFLDHQNIYTDVEARQK